jgi:hypothetical protein
VPQHEQCRQIQQALDNALGSVPYEIKRAAQKAFPKVTAAVAKSGLQDVLATRNGLLRELPGDARVQRLIVQRMIGDYCELIWSRPGGSAEEHIDTVRAVTQEVSAEVSYKPVAQTGSSPRQPGAGDAAGSLVAQVAFIPAAWTVVQDPAAVASTPAGYLRDPPLFVKDDNRWFVIVASPQTEAEGRRLMNRFKSKAPQYDFALYQPYAGNSYYAIMMASWVDETVARQALRDARRDVAAGAYLWRCRSSGDSC